MKINLNYIIKYNLNSLNKKFKETTKPSYAYNNIKNHFIKQYILL